MTFTLPQPPETANVRTIADYLNVNSGGGGGSTDWSDITSKPITLSGFGITDAYTMAASDARYAVAASTLAGYGITDAYTKSAADARYLQLSGGTVTGQTNVSGSVAGDYMATIQQASATGYGLFIRPGADTLAAIAINNAANTSQNIILYGSGNATLGGTVDIGTGATIRTLTVPTIQIGTTMPGGTPADGDLFALTS